MKKICHILTIIAVGLSAVMFSSCEKESEWGVRKVYMPQAAINNNTNHEYYVPMSGQQNENYSISDGKLNVFLGVYRSGQGDLQSYTVDVYYDAGASASAASTSLCPRFLASSRDWETSFAALSLAAAIIELASFCAFSMISSASSSTERMPSITPLCICTPLW